MYTLEPEMHPLIPYFFDWPPCVTVTVPLISVPLWLVIFTVSVNGWYPLSVAAFPLPVHVPLRFGVAA